MNTSPFIFDPAALRRHIARAAPHFARHDALFRDSADQIIDRIEDVKRAFPTALDLSPFLFLAEQKKESAVATAGDALMQDAEILPFAAESFDLIASNLALHWVNDVPGMLTQIHTILKPDGMFIASLIGGHSLHELRSCLIDAELAVTGGISPRLSPTIDLQGASALMQRAGFTLPVADIETVTLMYSDMFALMRDLRGMGQTNALLQRLRSPTRRTVFFDAARLYHERFANTESNIPATFDIIYLHGWR